jgi:hypothetical protein
MKMKSDDLPKILKLDYWYLMVQFCFSYEMGTKSGAMGHLLGQLVT